MRRLLILSLILSILGIQGCAGQKINLGKVLDGISKATQNGGLTNDEVISGLKQALQVGINKGADSASRLNGYFLNPMIKIPFPPEVQKVETALRKVGLGGEVDKFVMALNRGAEEAAKEAKPIFINAILSMNFSDAWAILRGEKNAATMYLKRTTSEQLIAAFSPVVEKALQKTQATRYYSDLANTYNRLPFVQKVNPDLKLYATEKAIDGLFILVENEEAKIRENPWARTTDLLKKVFGSI
ncbi:DUF4197 domain-containing protein [Emticicia sp. BO119]|uniref:DUF4197 domain-containing protein n=1 Tax=Emticicia sp. BO119 TaxID=2757768 RepID=UPI0015F021EB|nr:DUF4197 domain-containing protein [Emticicia sp. BO119]MBA4853582.1 DUF4197 domain-containing protein [Emticicia sp. BO119]